MQSCYHKGMNRPHGYTLIDVIAACLLVLILFLVFALAFSNPHAALERQHDEVRMDGVRDLMEAVLELKNEQPEVFWALMEDVAGGAKMIGTGVACGGPVTADACATEMPCLDLTGLLAPYVNPLPADPLVIEYSATSSGYYISFEDQVFEIGACSPQQRESIRLMSFIE